MILAGRSLVMQMKSRRSFDLCLLKHSVTKMSNQHGVLQVG
jgi:hypothetical protein